MISTAMLHANLVALLFAAIAHRVEQPLADLCCARRLVWISAAILTLIVSGLGVSCLGLTALPWTQTDTLLVSVWIAASTLVSSLILWNWFRLRATVTRYPRTEIEDCEIRISDAMGPAVFGWRRPVILFPAWLLGASAATRSIVLMHEREHLRARDHQLQLTMLILAVCVPWLVALWWMLQRTRVAIEMDCDARVVHQRNIDPVDYSEVLLEVNQHDGLRIPMIAASLTEPATQLERRIRVLCSDKGPTSLARTLLLVGLLALACFLSSQLHRLIELAA